MGANCCSLRMVLCHSRLSAHAPTPKTSSQLRASWGRLVPLTNEPLRPCRCLLLWPSGAEFGGMPSWSQGGRFYGASERSSRVIAGRIVLLQLYFYGAAAASILVSGGLFGTPLDIWQILDPSAASLFSSHGVCAVFAAAAAYATLTMTFSSVVQRAKLVADYAFTAFALHLLLSSLSGVSQDARASSGRASSAASVAAACAAPPVAAPARSVGSPPCRKAGGRLPAKGRLCTQILRPAPCSPPLPCRPRLTVFRSRRASPYRGSGGW